MKLSDVKTDADFDRYLDEKSYETYEVLHDELGVGECVDENDDVVEPSMWYWRGVSREMNEGIE